MSELKNGGVRPMKSLRTRITDIPALGEELTEEHLRLVTGGQRSCSGHSHTYSETGCPDIDASF